MPLATNVQVSLRSIRLLPLISPEIYSGLTPVALSLTTTSLSGTLSVLVTLYLQVTVDPVMSESPGASVTCWSLVVTNILIEGWFSRFLLIISSIKANINNRMIPAAAIIFLFFIIAVKIPPELVCTSGSPQIVDC